MALRSESWGAAPAWRTTRARSSSATSSSTYAHAPAPARAPHAQETDGERSRDAPDPARSRHVCVGAARRWTCCRRARLRAAPVGGFNPRMRLARLPSAPLEAACANLAFPGREPACSRRARGSPHSRLGRPRPAAAALRVLALSRASRQAPVFGAGGSGARPQLRVSPPAHACRRAVGNHGPRPLTHA